MSVLLPTTKGFPLTSKSVSRKTGRVTHRSDQYVKFSSPSFQCNVRKTGIDNEDYYPQERCDVDVSMTKFS